MSRFFGDRCFLNWA